MPCIRDRLHKLQNTNLPFLFLLLGNCPPRFADTPVNTEPDPIINERHYLVGSASYEYNLPGLLGRALYIQKINDQCPSFDQPTYPSARLSPESYLKKNVVPETRDKLGPPLYESKVDKKAGLDLKVLIFTGEAQAQDVAEVALTDVLSASLPPNALRKGYQKEILSSLRSDECDAVIINAGTVSTLAYKWYRKWDGKTKIAGTAFEAGGNVYQENSKSNLKFVIAIDAPAVRISTEPESTQGINPIVVEHIKKLPKSFKLPRLILPPRER